MREGKAVKRKSEEVVDRIVRMREAVDRVEEAEEGKRWGKPY